MIGYRGVYVYVYESVTTNDFNDTFSPLNVLHDTLGQSSDLGLFRNLI